MLHPDQQRAVDYLNRDVPSATLQAKLRDAFASIEALFDSVKDRERQPAPGKWSPHEILDHLVLSHEPAIAQLEALLRGESSDAVAIPADLHRDERPSWETLRAQLGDIHRSLLTLAGRADDATSRDAKALVEMVIKVDGEARHWHERVDWKGLVQALRGHTMEHRAQLERAMD